MSPSLRSRSVSSSSWKHHAKLFTLSLAVLGSFFLLQVPKTHAATCTFTSVGDNLFATDANWSCGAAPTVGDDIVIPSATSVNAAGAIINVKSVSSSGAFNITDSVLMATSTITVNGGGSVTSTSGTISASSTLTVFSGGTVTSTNGLLDIAGAVSSTGSIGSSSGNMLFRSTFRNNGTFQLGSGVATTTGDFTSAFGSVFSQNSGRLEVNSGCSANSATNNPQSGTIRYVGSGDQIICGSNAFHHLDIRKTGGKVTLGGATIVNITGNLTINSPTEFFIDSLVAGNNNTISGSTTIVSGGSVTSTLENVIFTGVVSSTGSIGSSSGNITFDAAFQNNGTLDIGSGTSTMGLTVTSTGTILGRSGTLVLYRDFVNTGTFTPGTGKVLVTDAENQSVPGVLYNNFESTKTSGTVTFAASSTILGTLVNASGSTLATGANNLTVIGALTNAGTVQVAASQILHAPSSITNTGTITLGAAGYVDHPVDSVLLTDSSGTEASSYSTPSSIYVTVQDDNRNLLGDTAETIIAYVTVNAAGGSDSESVTLTETGVATGIFRNASALHLASSSVVSLSNGQIEISASGLGTTNYSDSQDQSDTDTGSDTATLTYVAASQSAGGGGGGGLGSSGSSALPPVVTTFQSSNQSLLDNLNKIGVAVHTLLKLPDDGNTATQEDSSVYYVGADGKRHAFPNDKVYFSWYQDFGGVQIINKDQLASIPLGLNVTYKPGKKMVKFTTDPKVYAVDKGGVLRWITSEAAAEALYGSAWNKNVDDVNDAFYANYTFGQNIAGLSDFNPASVEASVKYPSDSLGK